MDEIVSLPARPSRTRRPPVRYSETEGNDVIIEPNVCESTSCTSITIIDHKIKCARCLKLFCSEYITMKKDIIITIKEAKGNLWFCTDCLNSALQAVTADQEIELKCNEYFASINDRV